MQHDLVIIGAGPCGIAASLVAAQNHLQPLLIESSFGIGGQVHFLIDHLIRDIPGLPDVGAEELTWRWRNQLDAQGVDVRLKTAVRAVREREHSCEVVLANGSVLMAQAVLIASGVSPRRHLGVGAERVPWGKPHSGIDRAGQQVIVVGGGDEAFSAAASLLQAGAAVQIVIRAGVSARPSFVSKAKALGVTLCEQATVEAFHSGENGWILALHDGRMLRTDECYIRIGAQPNSVPLHRHQGTRLAGAPSHHGRYHRIRMGGDVVRPPAARYIASALGDGARMGRRFADQITMTQRGKGL
ncbi:MAG: NAD(P)/FAD-dependent oxidoreductase [Actinomycetota bacterium]